MKKIRKPKGRPSNEKKEEYSEMEEKQKRLEQKKRLVKLLNDKGEELIVKGKTSEGRQCIATAMELDREVQAIEKLDAELKNKELEKKVLLSSIARNDVSDDDKPSIFKIVKEDKDGELYEPKQHWDKEKKRWILDEEEKPLKVRRRKRPE